MIWTPSAVQQWFADHVRLHGAPYTLDRDQAQAVCDQHTNTLVVARAGSGKTRIIVAKAIFLVYVCNYAWKEVLIFMFNRAAAAEVNQRLAEVVVNQRPIAKQPLQVASTFHKFALDVLKGSGLQPRIISTDLQTDYLRQAFTKALGLKRLHPTARAEAFKLTQSFIARAGQSYPTHADLPALRSALQQSLLTATPAQAFYQKLGFAAYTHYLQQFQPPQLDFNQLLAAAAQELQTQAASFTCAAATTSTAITAAAATTSATTTAANTSSAPTTPATLAHLRYLMIDEYQDFSLPFFRLAQALRALYPELRLFAVGDDWQAINRFAGSDVRYFTDFKHFFPEDSTIIPLLTNYRSRRRIVENANRFMLTHYDPQALPAKTFQRRRGRITTLRPEKLRYDPTDLEEDAMSDGRYGKLLPRQLPTSQQKPAGQLLKQLFLLIKRHPRTSFLILHRHNFTTYPGLDLIKLQQALTQLAASEQVLTPAAFKSQIRFLTIHKSKGLEADIVVLLEFNRDLLFAPHPHGSLFTVFGDNRAQEAADQARLLYVALTRAKERLYLLTSDRRSLLTHPKNPLPKSA